MKKYSTVILDPSVFMINKETVFSCEHYSGEYVWGTILSTGQEFKIRKNEILRLATPNEMAKAYNNRYKGRNRICGKNQNTMENM